MRALLALGLAACVARSDQHEQVHSPAMPPFVAWNEGDVVVVMPLRSLPGGVRVGGRRLGPDGGRVTVKGPVEVSWSDPDGAAGARVVLGDNAEVTAPVFVPIVRHRSGQHGPIVDQAVRIR